MKEVLLLGYSSFARRRVLPALAGAGVSSVDIASGTRSEEARRPDGQRGRLFTRYEVALEQSDAELVYISTHTSTHVELTRAALESHRHVIVDKPLAADPGTARELVELAKSHDRLLAEATVYAYHPQIDAVRRLFTEARTEPTHVAAYLSFPPLPAHDFRYRAELGGGALWDLGPYAVSPGRLFFAAEPREILARVTGGTGSVDTSFSVLATYPGGRSLVGHFGFTTGYTNRLELLGPDMTVSLDRAFTTPPELVPVLRVHHEDRRRDVEVPAADSFAPFLAAVRRALPADAVHGREAFAADLLSDADALERLRQAVTASSALH